MAGAAGGGLSVTRTRARGFSLVELLVALTIGLLLCAVFITVLQRCRSAIAVNESLASQYGKGYWSYMVTEKGVLYAMRTASVYVARYRNKLIATLALSTVKPWAIDKKYFSPSDRPLYLTAMAVHPGKQR